MSFEKRDSLKLNSSSSVTGPSLTEACGAICGLRVDGVGDCGKNVWGFWVGPVGGSPQAFGVAKGFWVGLPAGGPQALGAPEGFGVGKLGTFGPLPGLGVDGSPQAFGTAVGCWPGFGVDWDGSGGKSSFVVFCVDVDVVGCWWAGLGGGVGESERGGTLGVETTMGISTRDDCTAGFGVEGATGTDLAVDDVNGTDFAVVDVDVELVATDFLVVGVVGGSWVVVVVSLSFDLKKPVIPLKNPFFFVVSSGTGVVVVGLVTGGKGLNSASA